MAKKSGKRQLVRMRCCFAAAPAPRCSCPQNDAKRAVAVALRSRWRRNQLSEELKEEVYPKNILMIGPTGVGKTEISRRLAKLANAPFIKIEATKFTEVGYVGRDVEQIIRDLVESSILMVRKNMREEKKALAEEAAEERVITALAGKDARETTLETGRTHQIRVHLSEAGWPVLGDPVYGRGWTPPPAVAGLLGGINHQLLHAAQLGFDHPETGARLHFEAPPPADFARVLAALRAG